MPRLMCPVQRHQTGETNSPPPFLSGDVLVPRRQTASNIEHNITPPSMTSRPPSPSNLEWRQVYQTDPEEVCGQGQDIYILTVTQVIKQVYDLLILKQS